MTKPTRLDLELVRRGLVRSRTEAQRVIQEGKVVVRGLAATNPATLVSPDVSIAIAGPVRRFVSRGGEKLDAALDRFDVEVPGRKWLDAGASTGGFTDCLLKRGAEAVAAVDVGYGQFDWSLRNDPRVVLLERVNVRSLGSVGLPWVPDSAVGDLSFISLTQVLPHLREVTAPEGDFVLLVKPQFEVGRDSVGSGGVVRDPALWRSALERVVSAAGELGLGLAAAVPSSLTGPAGNREFFVHFRSAARSRPPRHRSGAGPGTDAIGRAVEEAKE